MKKLAFIFLCALQFSSYAQRGPGGVSIETTGPSDSNNKLWLDAGSITASDGTRQSIWHDESISKNINNATQPTVNDQPIYKSDPSATINGLPIIRFGSGRRFLFVTADDINNSGPYTKRTNIITFRTGADVTTRQMLYEQGGTVRGLNIFVFNGELYIGGYDLNADGDGTPLWGYTYIKTNVVANNVYIVSQVFFGPLGATGGYIKGYLNGVPFASVATGIGSLWTHTDPPGLGAVNGDSYNELGQITADGSQPFLGDVAEFIMYQDTLNNAERIIVENYLSAKYFANLAVNDRYEWQLKYGFDVIGIGQEGNFIDRHNVSRGRNIFQIEADTANFNNGDYFLTGHDNASIGVWTTVRAPNSGTNVSRLLREWKADHTGNLGDVTITLDISGLPAAPVGYTKYGIAVDTSRGLTSNFNSPETYIVELANTSGSLYQGTLSIPDSAHLCIVVINSTVEFVLTASNRFETDANYSTTVEARLNYDPSVNTSINFTAVPNTATLTNDYTNIVPVTGILTFNPGSNSANISFDVVGDLTSEVTENFSFTLQNGAGSTPGLQVGSKNQHTITIYDNDNTPKIGFDLTSSSSLESDGTVYIKVLRSGNSTPVVSCDYRLRIAGGSGTATIVNDYTFSNGTLTFASSQTIDSIPVTILTDLVDELDETVIIELYNNSVGADFETGKVEHTLTITDITPAPEISFTLTSQTNAESLGAPTIEVSLTRRSTKDISVQYTVDGASTATNGSDYTLGIPGLLTILAGDSTGYIPLFVVSDGLTETSETIILKLLDNASLVDATLGSDSIHTYTIDDYTAFEFLGTAGIGDISDNVVWYIADSLAGTHGTAIATLIDQSPHAIDALGASGQQALLQTSSNLMNGHKVLHFDGTNDLHVLPNDALINVINVNSPALSRFIFLVIRTGSDVTNRQMIYEQGGSTRGLNIYLESGNIYFTAWNNSFDNSDATTPWGGTGANAKAVNGGSISTGTEYLLTFVYDFNATNQLEGFVNGVSVGSVSDASIGRLYNHTDAIGLGGISGSTLFPSGSAANNFGGDIAEIVYYGNAKFNEARRRILENYFAGKYGISITNQYYSFGATYGHEIAGVGKVNPSHLDAQGSAILRISNPTELESGEFLIWGHNNASLDTGEVVDVPTLIQNRMTRVWRADGTGDVGNVTLRMDLSDFVINSGSDLELLIDADGDFSTGATKHTTGRVYDPVSEIVTFTAVDLDPGDFFTMGSNSFMTPLPITLVSFDAIVFNKAVQLNWTTASEINASHFVAERTTDGNNFTEIGQLAAAGDSRKELNYQLIDSQPYIGTSYYRLKMVDFDGTTKYSKLKSVVFEPNDEAVFRLYPNPVQEQIFISVKNGSLPEISSISLYSAGGAILDLGKYTENIEESKLEISLPSIVSPGLYYLEIITEKNKQVIRLVIE